MDTAGRKYGGSLNIPDKLVVILSLARSIFFITTYMITYNVINKAPSDLGLLNSDAFIVINMILFAFTNGYVST